ncbi:hypothetical protein DSAG12_02707 [Promethearchaeum syntrophicum]|uniref:Uncharacterized protein n=1 Tax=Promethearchaeum syntrophicum TaxID=2594042 RepID=A0A5B9DDC6_9ARCH|nr:hypothetical protein [Candidatus Prometheoarchaeum syntrophicum]
MKLNVINLSKIANSFETQVSVKVYANKFPITVSGIKGRRNFIYGILLESIIMLHDNPGVNIKDQVILTLKKIVKK